MPHRFTLSKVLLFGAMILAIGPLSPAAESNGTKSSSGFLYYRDEVSDVPWSINLVKIDRTNPTLQLHTIYGKAGAIALVPLQEQIKSFPEGLGRPIAAINGDFYQNRPPYVGDPKGVQISHGELISAPFDWTCIWVDASNTPTMGKVESRLSITWPDGKVTPIGLNENRTPSRMVLYTRAVGSSTRTSGGREFIIEKNGDGKWLPLQAGEEYSAVVKEIRETGNTKTSTNSMILSVGPKAARNLPNIKPGDVVRISTETLPSLKGVPTAISGGPALIRDGKILVGWSAIRHPRSAIGWNKDYIYLMQVDGRQANLSVGMTYSELAEYMKKLGCEEALNLDGGGSSTFWALGQVINSPSEGQARGVANGLVLVQKSILDADDSAPAAEKSEAAPLN